MHATFERYKPAHVLVMLAYTVIASALYVSHQVVGTANALLQALRPTPPQPKYVMPPTSVDEDDYEGLLRIGKLVLSNHKAKTQLQKARVEMCTDALELLEKEILLYEKCKRMHETMWFQWRSTFDEEEWLVRKNKAAHLCRLRLKWIPEWTT